MPGAKQLCKKTGIINPCSQALDHIMIEELQSSFSFPKLREVFTENKKGKCQNMELHVG